MFKVSQIRKLREARIAEAGDPGRGSAVFVDEMRDLLGITEDEFGRPVLEKGAARPEELTVRGLAEAIIGHDWIEDNWNPRNQGLDRRTLLEAGPGIDPTAFLNINTFSLTVGGLIEAKIIEAFNNPLFIGDQLATVMPTTKNGEKLIGVTGIGDKGESRKPGQPHARAGFGEHYVTTPELDEKALAVEVLQETVFYDLTNQVMQTAAGVGNELGYLREKTLIDLAIGVTNPYVYNGTGYSTYQTATPWINKVQNVMQDYSDFDVMDGIFTDMTDPATGKEILVMPNTLLVSTRRTNLTDQILSAMEIRNTTNTNTVTISRNPIKRSYSVLSSPIVNNRVNGSTGLNLGTTNGPNNWWAGDFKKAFAWMEAWPLRTRPAQATEYVMLDRGLIAAFFSNYRGIGAVIEPRHVAQFTH